MEAYVRVRICHVSDSLPYHHNLWGGAEKHAYNLLKVFSRRGHEVFAVTTKTSNKKQEDFKIYQLETFQEKSPQNSLIGEIQKITRAFLNLLEFDPITYGQFKSILDMTDPDVVHFHNFSTLSFSMVEATKKLGIPSVLHVYDYRYFCPKTTLLNGSGETCRSFHGPHCVSCLSRKKRFAFWRKQIYDYSLKMIDAFVVLSKNSYKILKCYGIPEEKIHVVPQLFPHATERVDADIEDGLLFVGWLEHRKGLHVLVEALKYVVSEFPHVKLHVVGASTDRAYVKTIKDRIKDLEIKDSVLFHSRLPKREYRQLFSNSKVLVIPEQWQNMCPVLLVEAMFKGKTVVASRIGGIPEFIEDGVNGYLVDPKSPREFAEKIVFALENDLGENAMADAVRLFDENETYLKLMQLYEGITA